MSYKFEVGQQVVANPTFKKPFVGKVQRVIFDKANKISPEYLIAAPFQNPVWIAEPYLSPFEDGDFMPHERGNDW